MRPGRYHLLINRYTDVSNWLLSLVLPIQPTTNYTYNTATVFIYEYHQVYTPYQIIIYIVVIGRLPINCYLNMLLNPSFRANRRSSSIWSIVRRISSRPLDEDRSISVKLVPLLPELPDKVSIIKVSKLVKTSQCRFPPKLVKNEPSCTSL